MIGTVEIIAKYVFYLGVFISGVIFFYRTAPKVKAISKGYTETVLLFLLIATYACLLTLFVDTLLCMLGWPAVYNLPYAIYVGFIAPFVTGTIAFVMYNKRKFSVYYLWIYRWSMLYWLILPCMFIIFSIIFNNITIPVSVTVTYGK